MFEMDQSSGVSGKHYWANSARIFHTYQETVRNVIISPLSSHLLVVPALHSHIPHSQWEFIGQPPRQVLVR